MILTMSDAFHRTARGQIEDLKYVLKILRYLQFKDLSQVGVLQMLENHRDPILIDLVKSLDASQWNSLMMGIAGHDNPMEIDKLYPAEPLPPKYPTEYDMWEEGNDPTARPSPGYQRPQLTPEEEARQQEMLAPPPPPVAECSHAVFNREPIDENGTVDFVCAYCHRPQHQILMEMMQQMRENQNVNRNRMGPGIGLGRGDRLLPKRKKTSQQDIDPNITEWVYWIHDAGFHLDNINALKWMAAKSAHPGAVAIQALDRNGLLRLTQSPEFMQFSMGMEHERFLNREEWKKHPDPEKDEAEKKRQLRMKIIRMREDLELQMRKREREDKSDQKNKHKMTEHEQELADLERRRLEVLDKVERAKKLQQEYEQLIQKREPLPAATPPVPPPPPKNVVPDVGNKPLEEVAPIVFNKPVEELREEVNPEVQTRTKEPPFEEGTLGQRFKLFTSGSNSQKVFAQVLKPGAAGSTDTEIAFAGQRVFIKMPRSVGLRLADEGHAYGYIVGIRQRANVGKYGPPDMTKYSFKVWMDETQTVHEIPATNVELSKEWQHWPGSEEGWGSKLDQLEQLRKMSRVLRVARKYMAQAIPPPPGTVQPAQPAQQATPGTDMTPKTPDGQPAQPGDYIQPQGQPAGTTPENQQGTVQQVNPDGSVIYQNADGQQQLQPAGNPVQVVKPAK